MREDYEEPGELTPEEEEANRYQLEEMEKYAREVAFEEARKKGAPYWRVEKNLYLPKNSKTFWLKYSKNGKPIWENTHMHSLAEARKYRDLRLGQRVSNTLPELRVNKILFDEIAEDYLVYYRVNDLRSIDRAEYSVKALKKYFSGMKVIDIATDKIEQYKLDRKKAGKKNGTINRELAALHKMLSLADDSGKINKMPKVKRPAEAKPRKIYFTHGEIIEAQKHLPPHLQILARASFLSGMRKGELQNLRWEPNIDIDERFEIKVTETKNKEVKIIPLVGELLSIIQGQRNLMRLNHPNCPWVFFQPNGKQIKDFRGSWKKALKEAGILDHRFHDLRRSMSTNLREGGIADGVGMQLTGHKTQQIYRNYQGTNQEHLKAAMLKLEAYNKEKFLQAKLKTVKMEGQKGKEDN